MTAGSPRSLVTTWKFIATFIVALLSVSPAFAAPPAHGGGAEAPAPAASSIALHAVPVFGADAATGFGWTEIIARVDNGGAAPMKGTLELVNALAYGDTEEFTTRAPFNVPAGRTALVRLPTHGYAYQPSTVNLVALDEHGATLGTCNVTINGSVQPLLVDVDEPSRLGVVLRSANVPSTWNPSGGYGSGSASMTLTVGAPTYDRTTGDPVLPEHAAEYAPVSAVVIHSDTLARLESAQLEALANWVLSGGTLAVIPTRPEDLRNPTLAALVGGNVTAVETPARLLTIPAFDSSGKSVGGGASPTSPFDPDPDPAYPTPPTIFGGRVQIGPTRLVRPHLTGYSGGNLRPSDYGATAAYGLGEVHLLAFDPTLVPMIDDPWVQSRMIALVARAWDRGAIHAFPQGSLPHNASQVNDVRRALDPNENFRPALGVAAILLVIYSIVSGPITFMRAAKKGKPLSPLKWAPVWSIATFGLVVFIGFAGKGFRGRARHVSLIEAGGGVSRGSIRRFRGFFTSEARSVSIASTDRSSVLGVITGDSTAKDHDVLRLDRNGATLENLTSLPWQTVVVQEDGFAEIKDGVAILPAGVTFDVVNHTGHTLLDVIVSVPGADATYFPRMKDGEKIRASTGQVISYGAARHATTAGSLAIHPLDESNFPIGLPGKDGTRLRETWAPFDTAAGAEVDWWPSDVPVVLAEMEGGEGRSSDSGLSLESDRTLLRIVGAGGTP